MLCFETVCTFSVYSCSLVCILICKTFILSNLHCVAFAHLINHSTSFLLSFVLAFAKKYHLSKIHIDVCTLLFTVYSYVYLPMAYLLEHASMFCIIKIYCRKPNSLITKMNISSRQTCSVLRFRCWELNTP